MEEIFKPDDPRRSSRFHRLLRVTPGTVPRWVLAKPTEGGSFDLTGLALWVGLVLLPIAIAVVVADALAFKGMATFAAGLGTGVAGVAAAILVERTVLKEAHRTERIARRRTPLGSRRRKP
jgi:hypothetical protein